MMIRIAAVLAVTLAAACAAPERPVAQGDEIAVYGLLRTGVIAPAGDTTGIVVASYDGLDYELALDGPALAHARQLDGQHVFVAGELAVRQAADGDTRLIIHVQRLRHEPLK